MTYGSSFNKIKENSKIRVVRYRQKNKKIHAFLNSFHALCSSQIPVLSILLYLVQIVPLFFNSLDGLGVYRPAFRVFNLKQ